MLRREKKDNAHVKIERGGLLVYHRFGEEVKHRTKNGNKLIKDAKGSLRFVGAFCVLVYSCVPDVVILVPVLVCVKVDERGKLVKDAKGSSVLVCVCLCACVCVRAPPTL